MAMLDHHGMMELVIIISLKVIMIFQKEKKLGHITQLGEYMGEDMAQNKCLLSVCLMYMLPLEVYVEIIQVHIMQELVFQDHVLTCMQDQTRQHIGFLK